MSIEGALSEDSNINADTGHGHPTKYPEKGRRKLSGSDLGRSGKEGLSLVEQDWILNGSNASAARE